jgi:hypothetical protein
MMSFFREVVTRGSFPHLLGKLEAKRVALDVRLHENQFGKESCVSGVAKLPKEH